MNARHPTNNGRRDMETKHTAGPWQISRTRAGKNGTSLFIWRNDEGPNGSEETNTNWSCIAQHIHSEANARLIAAAPEMLAALNLAEKNMTASPAFNSWDLGPAPSLLAVRAAVLAAVRKAEGGDA